jgi:DNA-binding NtrC family response regulator
MLLHGGSGGGVAVQLFADRFVVTGGCDGAHRAVDLATGGLVTVLTSTAGGASDQMRWSVRCDRFFRVRHRCIARLIDYGLVGPVTRFEAWRCADRWPGSGRIAAATLARAEMFLHASGASDGGVSLADLRSDGGRPVLLPRPATGYEREAAGPTSIDDTAVCGVTIIERPSVGAVIEILATAKGPSPVAIGLGAIDGAGGSVAAHQLARVARMHGFVPLSNLLVPFDGFDALDGRTLCLIDRRGGNGVWQHLLDRLLRAQRPHVLISIGANILPAARRIHLERIRAETLIQSVTPRVESAALLRTVERAAARAEGLPARFAERLWGPGIPSHTADRPRAAETPPLYGAEATSSLVVASPAARVWPAAPDVAACRKRLADALELLQRGRHAPAERTLRAVIGSLARRRDWHHAAQGQMALAGALLSRGKAQTARETLDDARAFAVRAGQDVPLVDVGVLAGHAQLDQGRLDEAETMLRGSMAAARASGTATALAGASTALARCLFWRGRFGEADAVLDAATADDAGGAVRLEVLRSRVALGRGDIGAAMSHASSARDSAERHGDPAAIARALHAVAFAHLVAGDLRSVGHDVDLCVKAARTAHDPLRALKARLLDAEARRRTNGGSTERVRHLVERAGRVDLPVTIRARLALLADLSRGVDDAVRRQVAGTGLHGLALFAPVDAHQRAVSACDAAIDILMLCQTGEDERAVLAEVCRRIRERLRAAGVAIFIRDGQPLVPLVVDGNAVEPSIAARAIDARQSIPPRQYHERIEGAVPIRYAGETVGALAVRWTVADPPDPARADMLLTMTATAAATAVMGAAARRRAAGGTGLAEILGISRAIADVREAVERAAAAPFPVLVEGESGSGKELIARALHRRSIRRDRSFCALNCAALPDDLVDAELFGHSRGAFTGAVSDRQGVFEEAHLGTLFLDEVGELSPRAQAKVLRTLQDGDLRRVGENTSRRVDVRVVAATNRDLRQEVSAGRFRLDLLYRLDVVRITVPPLRDRRDDIPLLAEQFWHAAAERVGSRAVLSAQTIAVLTRHDWPGNVRELQNVLASLAVRAAKRGLVAPTALPPAFGTAAVPATWRLGEARRSFEERFIRAALARSGGHRGRAADELGLSRQGLAKLMARLHIT